MKEECEVQPGSVSVSTEFVFVLTSPLLAAAFLLTSLLLSSFHLSPSSVCRPVSHCILCLPPVFIIQIFLYLQLSLFFPLLILLSVHLTLLSAPPLTQQDLSAAFNHSALHQLDTCLPFFFLCLDCTHTHLRNTHTQVGVGE